MPKYRDKRIDADLPDDRRERREADGYGERVIQTSTSSSDADLSMATAYHEAGHAVMAYYFRVSMRNWTIKLYRHGRAVECVRLSRTADIPDKGEAWSFALFPRKRLDHVLILLAGPLAEFRHLNRGRSPSGVLIGKTDDLEEAHRLLAEISADNDRVWATARYVVRQLLCRRPFWFAVQRLAEAIRAHGTLSGEEVERICQGAPQRAESGMERLRRLLQTP